MRPIVVLAVFVGLKELRRVWPERAELIEDVNSEVLADLSRFEAKDPTMVKWLLSSIEESLLEAAYREAE